MPAVLALGARAQPNVYLAFGDSITWGEGSSDGSGYSDELEADLRAFWGKAGVTKDGAPGTKSNKGESRMGQSLNTYRPAYVLILYGTNDWNDPECRDATFPATRSRRSGRWCSRRGTPGPSRWSAPSRPSTRATRIAMPRRGTTG